jgi:hypothetical protein
MCPLLSAAVYEVSALSCQEATFRASLTTYEVGGGRFKPYDLENDEYTGVVAVAKVISGYLVPTYRPDIEIERELNAPDSVITVFIDGNVSQICSGDRHKKLTISTTGLCCDTIPRKGICLVPLPVMKEKRE